jgi:hypothetical protein
MPIPFAQARCSRGGNVLLELSVTPFNLNAPLAFEAHAFMERIGFMLVDVVELNYNGRSMPCSVANGPYKVFPPT